MSFISELTLPRTMSWARLHALDSWERKPREIGKLALIHVEQGACGTHLQRR